MNQSARITKVEVKYGFEQSDHASVSVGIHINEDIEVGPGLTRINSSVLNFNNFNFNTK